MITKEVHISASTGIESANLDGEAVILDVNSGLYYGLSTVGARIMDFLKETVQVRKIIDSLETEYDVEKERLESDILNFLNEMEDRGLVQVQDGEVA